MGDTVPPRRACGSADGRCPRSAGRAPRDGRRVAEAEGPLDVAAPGPVSIAIEVQVPGWKVSWILATRSTWSTCRADRARPPCRMAAVLEAPAAVEVVDDFEGETASGPACTRTPSPAPISSAVRLESAQLHAVPQRRAHRGPSRRVRCPRGLDPPGLARPQRPGLLDSCRRRLSCVGSGPRRESRLDRRGDRMVVRLVEDEQGMAPRGGALRASPLRQPPDGRPSRSGQGAAPWSSSSTAGL